MILHDIVSKRSSMATTIFASNDNRGDVSLGKSELVAIFMETSAYGIEALTFVITVYLLHGAQRNKLSLIKFGAVILMFLMNTIHIGTSLRRILNAFVGTTVDLVPDATDYLSDITGFLYRFKNILILIQTVMLDIIVTYRCYMVWDRKLWAALVPAPSIIAYLVTGIAAIHALAVYKNDIIFTGITKTWVIATLCVTLLTKLLCLVIVTLGIILPRGKSVFHTTYLKVNRHVGLYKAAIIGIESGALATLCTLILVPVYVTGKNAQSILWGAMSPLIGESFLLIIFASLLGLTPSMSGASRRRKGTIPNTRITIPPIPVSPVHSPGSRFSVAGSVFKPHSGPPISPSDYDKSALPFSEPNASYPGFHPGDYDHSQAYPFGRPLSKPQDRSVEVSIRDALAYGGGKTAREDRSLRRSSREGGPRNASHIARSTGEVVGVQQNERVPS